MSTEEIKMILDAVDGATGDAVTVVVTWVVADFARLVVTAGAWLAGVCVVFRLAYKMVLALCMSTRFVREYAERKGLKLHRGLDGWYSDESVKRLFSELEKESSS